MSEHLLGPVKQVYRWIEASERWVDREAINLYAGTNRQSSAVRRAMQTTLNARPSLGDPGDKYETGLEYSDRIEAWACDRIRAVFSARWVEHRVLSGSMANLYALMATTEPGDTVFAMPSAAAGHATHHQEGAAGLYGLHVKNIPLVPGTHLINWPQWREEAAQLHPRLIILGSSLPLLSVDVAKAREIADAVKAYLMYDAAHVAGLVAAGRFQQPLQQGAHLMTMSTYKTLGGPAGGLVVTNDGDLAQRIRAIAYPGLTANFDMARVAGLGIACYELEVFGQAYADQCLRNAARLAEELVARNIPVWRPDGEHSERITESHLVAIDASNYGGGTRAARRSEASNVLFSGIPLPIPEVAQDYNGIRLGVQEITRLGMHEVEMAQVANFIDKALNAPERAEKTRREVREFRREFQTVQFGFNVDED